MSPPAAAVPADRPAREWRQALTPRGWAVSAIAVVLAGVGALIHLDELFPLAAAAAVLIVSALVWVRGRSWAVAGHRVVSPPRIALGGVARVDLGVTNQGSRPSPVLSARDPFDNGRRFARFAVAPLAPGATVQASYRLPTSRRGVFPLGPLEFRLHDPLGLATACRPSGGRSHLCVHPAIEPLPPLPGRWGAPDGAGARVGATSAHGTEFYALREYQVGDDLRRVHWTSSARRDELMIRQDHDITRPRTLLVGDVRAAVHTARSLERALSAVASLTDAAVRGGHAVRIVLVGTATPADSGWGEGSAHRGAILDLLSRATPHETAGRPGFSLMRGRPPAAGADAAPDDTDAVRRARFDAGARDTTVVVTTDAARPGELAPPPVASAEPAPPTVVIIEREDRPAPSGAPAPLPETVAGVRVAEGASFAAAWGRSARTGPAQAAGVPR